jgi:hypothetical protein
MVDGDNLTATAMCSVRNPEEADGRGKMGVLFPLTPALSLRERENRSPVLKQKRSTSYANALSAKRSKDRRSIVCFLRKSEHRLLFPLPPGEGKGEGDWGNLTDFRPHALFGTEYSWIHEGGEDDCAGIVQIAFQ